MANSKGKITAKIVLIIIAVIVLVGVSLAAAFVAKYTDNFKTAFATFYVELNGKTILSEETGLEFELNKEYRVDVGYAFGFLNDKYDYDVKILPNATDDTNFTFESQSTKYSFKNVPDLTKQFVINREADHFTVRPTKLLQELLASTYGESLSGIPTSDFKHDYLKMVVSSEDGASAIIMTFNVVLYPTGVNMGNDNIVGG